MADDVKAGFFDPSSLVDGPFTITYTAHLPFPIGIPNELGHALFLSTSFKDPSVTEHFGPRPFVKIDVFDTLKPGLRVWQEGTHAAVEHFYGVQLDDNPDARYGKDQFMAHDQWVTLETPYALLENEDPSTDPGFSFHRCLGIFNLFLETALLLTRDIRIRRISTHDLRPAVIIGARQKGKEWRVLSVMFMQPEAMPEELLTTDKPFSQSELNDGLYAVLTRKPYLNTAIWRSRAQRALRQTGDATDAIVSFQVAAESMLFDTYRMLLVDEGRSSTEISIQLAEEIPFKSLLTHMLPEKLGGSWDVSRKETPVGGYWSKLYLMRNAIIHTGRQAHTLHAEEAQTAYRALRDYLEARMWAKRKTYPRTLYARLEREQINERRLSASMRRIIDEIEKGPQPYYWPHDLRSHAEQSVTEMPQS